MTQMDENLPDQGELKALLHYAGTLADEQVVRIIGVLTSGERSAEELATLLKLRTADVSRHLGRLCWLGLASQHNDDGRRLYRFDPSGLKRMSRAVGQVSKEAFAGEKTASAVDDPTSEVWQRRVLQSFFEGERLKEIPSSYKKKLVVLRWLVHRFDEQATYPEREVNEILKRYHPDCATLRRELVDGGFMQRQEGTYWRLPLPALAERLQQGDQ